jgi:hypothetical protein
MPSAPPSDMLRRPFEEPTFADEEVIFLACAPCTVSALRLGAPRRSRRSVSALLCIRDASALVHTSAHSHERQDAGQGGGTKGGLGWGILKTRQSTSAALSRARRMATRSGARRMASRRARLACRVHMTLRSPLLPANRSPPAGGRRGRGRRRFER